MSTEATNYEWQQAYACGATAEMQRWLDAVATNPRVTAFELVQIMFPSTSQRPSAVPTSAPAMPSSSVPLASEKTKTEQE